LRRAGVAVIALVANSLQSNTGTVSGGEATLECSQEWFLSDGSDISGDNKLWTIPIFAVTDKGTVDDVNMMREKKLTFKVPVVDGSTFIKLNADQDVPCRVLYTSEMMANLSHGVLSKKICPVDRAGLILDSYALVKAGKMDASELVKLVYVVERAKRASRSNTRGKTNRIFFLLLLFFNHKLRKDASTIESLRYLFGASDPTLR